MPLTPVEVEGVGDEEGPWNVVLTPKPSEPSTEPSEDSPSPEPEEPLSP